MSQVDKESDPKRSQKEEAGEPKVEEKEECLFPPLLLLEKLLDAINTNSHNHLLDLDPCEVWEEFSLELVEWNILLKKLEKLISVQRFYSFLMQRQAAKAATELPENSIKVLSLKGKGKV